MLAHARVGALVGIIGTGVGLEVNGLRVGSRVGAHVCVLQIRESAGFASAGQSASDSVEQTTDWNCNPPPQVTEHSPNPVSIQNAVGDNVGNAVGDGVGNEVAGPLVGTNVGVGRLRT